MSTIRRFGTFLRTRRKVLGLTLREFCRRAGLDPGNVSRLERGLVPPPQAQDALESYAKALNLKPETEEWNKFLKLATAELAQKLPKVQERGQRHANWVTALDLEAWADSLNARSTLPQLVRRLVYATGAPIVRLEFPAGEQVQRPGWDGIAEATSGDAFVPEGTSGWELGVDKEPRAKAEDDFDKRTRNSLGLEKSQTTFVFITPRKWQKKAEWSAQKNNLALWKEVRAYDSATLEQWLECNPAVDVWLAELLGLRSKGLSSLDEHWANLDAAIGLKPEVFLTSRAKEIEELKKWLKGPPDALVIEARSPAEAIDFVAAISRDASERDALSARVLIVEQRDAWRAVAASGGKLLLIAHPSLPVEPELVAEAVRQGCHVLLSSNQQATERAPSIRLPRVYRYDLEQALISSGLDRERAARCARESGGSLTVLKRLLARFPGTTQPEWSRQPDASSLAPILLAGRWESASDGDRSALAKLANQSYSELLTVAERWLNVPDAPVMRVTSRWSLVSRDDSWHLLAPSVGADHLRRFEDVALEVLGEDDPGYELPPDKRWQASLHKKVLAHSQALRTGLAETLALLAAKPERIPGVLDLPGRVEHLVRTLLEGKNWKRWASLSPQLPLLAEAGPEAFLDAADHDLRSKDPALVKLFGQEGDPFFSSSPHTGLLWALEGLAWEPTYLGAVSRILARLADRDPNPNRSLASGPLRSLQEIFLPWLPQTTASVEERVKVLKVLVGRQQDAAWRLLISLLPRQQLASFLTYRPSVRDWALSRSKGATTAESWRTAEYRYQTDQCARLLVEHMGSDTTRWKDLMREFEKLPEPVQKELLERLGAFDPGKLDVAVRREITDALRKKISWHRQYASGSLPQETLGELEKLQRRFEPEDPVARNTWLFGRRAFERMEREDVDAAALHQQVLELRRQALSEIATDSGFKGVLALVEAAEAPEAVGLVLGEGGPDLNEPAILPKLLVSSNEKLANFAKGYALARYHGTDWDWLARLETAGWSEEEVGCLVVVLLQETFERRAWEFVTRMGAGIERYYWQHVGGFYQARDSESVAFVVSMLLKYQRPFRALNVLGMALHQKCVLEPALLMDALQAALDVAADQPEKDRSSDPRYAIHQVFMELQRRREGDAGIDQNALATLEWRYLELLDGQPASPWTLYTMLRDDPERFVELLCLVFRSGNEVEQSKREISDEERARVQNAYRLLTKWLTEWRQVPGSRKDGTIDEEALLGWLRKARELAAERGRLGVCDSCIGEVFGHARQGEPDGSWPCIPVRDAIEETDSDELVNGFQIGIFNERGPYSKAPTEGGDQEQALAATYRRYAEACKIEWPKTAAALRKVAQSYDEDARREDARVELDL